MAFFLGRHPGSPALPPPRLRVGFIAHPTPEVKTLVLGLTLDLLTKYHMHNFSIFLQQIDDRWYEFGYYEHDGKDFDRDMATLAREPRNIDWLKVCDPMQVPLPGAKGWTQVERIYFNP